MNKATTTLAGRTDPPPCSATEITMAIQAVDSIRKAEAERIRVSHQLAILRDAIESLRELIYTGAHHSRIIPLIDRSALIAVSELPPVVVTPNQKGNEA